MSIPVQNRCLGDVLIVRLIAKESKSRDVQHEEKKQKQRIMILCEKISMRYRQVLAFTLTRKMQQELFINSRQGIHFYSVCPVS